MVSNLLVLGVAVMLYPNAAQWFSAWVQRGHVEQYSEQIQQAPGEELAAELDRARAYNAQLAVGAGILDPFAAVDESHEAEDPTSVDDPYWNVLAGAEEAPMATLRIPTIDADLPIYHGTSEDTLKRGVGHLQGTALPVGGTDTHSVLTAHRGLPRAELFTRLNEVEVGDTFSVDVYGETLVYEVSETKVVEPHETETLQPQVGEDLITLVTCTPLGINTHRILVTAERTSETPEVSRTAPSDLPIPWWAIIISAALLLQIIYLRRIKAKQAARSGKTETQRH